MVRGKHHGADHETLLAVGQIFERNAHGSLTVGELDDKVSRVFANHRILDVLQVGHYLLEVLIDLAVGGWRVSNQARKPRGKVSDLKIWFQGLPA